MKFLIVILSLVSFNILACDGKSALLNSDVQIWLGNNSEFSKALNKSKCLLDKELEGLSLNNKKLIAKLILKSYQTENKVDKYSF
tara:strand:- start:368 stop:622 length:255 start_codon:yes stop_codon:yes gene_type:complete